MDNHASRARREGNELVKSLREGFEFTDEEVELLRREIAAVRGVWGIAELVLTGDSGTDWDDELARLEEWRQYGDD
jgi:hypothetical protein